MAFCAKCGTKLVQGANFCHLCGAPAVAAAATHATHQIFNVTGVPRLIVRNDCPGSIEITQNPTGGQVVLDWDLNEPSYLDWNASQSGDILTVNCRSRPGEFWPAVFSLGASRANILLRIPKQANLDLSCRFGSIDVDGVEGTLVCDTATGNLTFKNCSGSIESRTHTGLIDLQNVTGRVSARNSAGSIHFSGSLGGSGESWFRTKAGSIELALFGDPDLSIDATTRVGRVNISPELKPSQLRSEQFTVGHRIVCTVGSGSNRLFAETYTGTISISPGRPR